MIELKGKYGSAYVYTDVVDEASISQVIGLLNQPYAEGAQVRMTLIQILRVQRYLWMLVESMELRDIIRYLLMRFMVIYHLIDLTFSSQRRHLSIQAAHIVHQRLVQTFLYLHTTEHMACL